MAFRVSLALSAALAAVACGKGGGGFVPPPSDLPPLSHVVATVRADNASVTFDPVVGAKDYRIYEFPAAGVAATGKNMIYRCAGDREAPAIPLDADTFPPGGAILTWVNHDVRGFARTTAGATLGYVFTDPGSGRVAVHALGSPAPDGDNACFFDRFDETRLKVYTTDDAQAQTLIGQGWRDFGTPFYAPAPGTAGTVQIWAGVLSDAQLYFPDGAEKTARASANPTPAFLALAAQATGAQPLLRVFYTSQCGKGHDELVAGQARFDHAAKQGNTPVTSLLWSGLQGTTTLAIEALDDGCPFQGHLAPVSIPSFTYAGTGTTVTHQSWFTLDQLQAADPNHNVYINGQHDGTNPKPFLRSFVQVSPASAESWDFHDGFDTDPGPLTENTPAGGLFETRSWQTPKYDIQMINYQGATLFGLGVIQKELWVSYADSGTDRNAKFRIAPRQTATLSASSFLHASMEVDLVTTNRRYPQILISDQPAPVQLYPTESVPPVAPYDNMINGHTVVIQPFDGYPSRMDLEVCDKRDWDVNNQCPHFTTDWQTDLSTGNQPPVPLVGELYGVDRRVRFDVYLSTTRLYAMLDGKPMACANLPGTGTGTLPPTLNGPVAGPVTVTFGDVLYHSSADLGQSVQLCSSCSPTPFYGFHTRHQQLDTSRHFDELAFKSGVSAPTWDETKVPCYSAVKP